MEREHGPHTEEEFHPPSFQKPPDKRPWHQFAHLEKNEADKLPVPGQPVTDEQEDRLRGFEAQSALLKRRIREGKKK